MTMAYVEGDPLMFLYNHEQELCTINIYLCRERLQQAADLRADIGASLINFRKRNTQF